MNKFCIIGALIFGLSACSPAPQEKAAMSEKTLQTRPMQEDGLVTKLSAHSVEETINRLEAVVLGKGLTVFARIDHQANAAKLGLTMPASTLLIFGSPKMGAPLMNASRTIGIDLPVKALAYEDEDGKIYLSYNDPAYLKARHKAEGVDAVLTKMSGAVSKLTNHAAGK